jgi:hypothetical protein
LVPVKAGLAFGTGNKYRLVPKIGRPTPTAKQEAALISGSCGKMLLLGEHIAHYCSSCRIGTIEFAFQVAATTGRDKITSAGLG